MLIWKQTARLAPHHSPTREQREVRFAVSTPTSVDAKKEEKMIEDFSDSKRRIDAQREIYRRKYTMVSDLIAFDADDEQFTVQGGFKMHEVYAEQVSEFVRNHTEYLQSYYRNVLGKTLNEKDWKSIGFIQSLRSLFALDIKEISKRNLELYGPGFEGCSTDEVQFTKKYMRSIYGWDKAKEITDSEVEEFRVKNHVPNGYIDATGTIRLNLMDESLNYQKMLKKRKAENPNIDEMDVLKETEDRQKELVVHELTHFTLDMKSEVGKYSQEILRKLPKALFIKSLQDHPYWREIEENIKASYGGKAVSMDDNRILHEAMAIYVTGKHVQYNNTDPRKRVCMAFEKLLEACLERDPTIIEMLTTIESQVQHFVDGDGKTPSQYEVITKQMNQQTNEQDENKQFRANLKKRNIRGSRYEEDGFTVAANTATPDPDKELKDQMNEEAEEGEKELAGDPGKILKTIKSIEESYAWLQDNRDSLLAKIPEEFRAEETLALDNIMECVGRDMNDLGSIKNSTQKLQNWHQLKPDEKNALISHLGMENKGQYDQMSNQGTIIELDRKYHPQIQEQLQNFLSTIALCAQFDSIIKITKKMQELDDTDKDITAKHEESLKHGEQTFLGSLYKKYLGKESGVHWLSWYDVVKIYGIYKDAILEKYHSSQKIRTYDAAKALNIYKPLQVDLDKQARSANDEETSKYKEFLEKEGKTYDELFLDTNSEVVKNKHNINRHKAIIDYAAAHAWLYSLDRGNGHNVYGLDYEGIWGKRSFDELVEHNAASQDKEKGNGKAKVNNDPDIPLLVEEIERELHHKNIWVVLGIVERLQEKAKYAESNTWCLVTIINALREDASLRKVFEAGGKGMMDAIGGIGIGQSAWSLTLFKTQRHALIDWIKAGCTDEAMESVSAEYEASGYLTPGSFIPKVIKHIEHKLVRDPSKVLTKTKEDGLNHNAGKILAAQVVKNDVGESVTIFEDDQIFNGYRDYWGTRQTSTDPSVTDDDFFDPGNNGSDIRLLHEEGVKAILRCTSLGQFDSPTKARGYLTQLLMLEAELRENNPRAHKKFIEETRRKLSFWYSEAVNNGNTAKTFGGFMTSNIGSHPHVSNKNVCATLWKLGLIDRESYIIFITRIEGKIPDALAPLGEALKKLETLKNDKKAGKATEADVKTAQEAVEAELRRTGPSSAV